MAIAAVANKRPFKNCKKMVMWKMTDEENETYSASKISFEKRLTTYTDSVETNSTPLYGDGESLEDAVSEGSGSLALGIHHLTDDERVTIYNETAVSSGAVVSTGDEVPPYMCVALEAEKRSGRLNLRKWFKVCFKKHEEQVTQQQSGGITYSMPTLNGTYSKNNRLGYKVVRVEVDPTTEAGQEFITNWYANAEFIGNGNMVNASKMKLTSGGSSQVTLNSGDSITSGDTVVFFGDATGGTSPYKYNYYYRAVGSDEWTTKAVDQTSAATQVITVTTATDYNFKIVAVDANGVSLTKLWTIHVNPASV